MRITGGAWRSRRLKGPSRGSSTRPTPDAMRERCFAVLASRIENARVLDLFSGTGAIGIEALSRGAASAVFVEAHRPAATVVTANIRSLEIGSDRAAVIVRPARRAVAELGRRGARFELIWADPPFEHWRDGLEALAATVTSGIASQDAVLCLECPADADVGSALPPDLVVERDLTGGASRVVLLRIG